MTNLVYPSTVLPFTSEFSFLIGDGSSLHYDAENDQMSYLQLSCTNLSNSELEELNLTVSWWKGDTRVHSSANEINITRLSSSSGFYCCQVLREDISPATVLTTVCATLVILGTITLSQHAWWCNCIGTQCSDWETGNYPIP